MTKFNDSSTPSGRPLRIGLKPLLIVTFAGLVLVALSSVFLLGLAAVGVLAVVVGGIELLRRHVIRARAPEGYLITGR